MKLPIPGKVRSAAIFVGLAVLTFATFEQVLRSDFVALDDDRYVTGNAWVREGLTHGSVAWAMRTTYFQSWHPMTWLSHMLDVEIHGLNAAGHHLTNLVLHVLNALLLLGLLRRMTSSPWPSALVAALFALHPLHVEPVAWVSARKDLLSASLGLLSMWAWVGYARRPGLGRYLMTAGLFALALMAKPALVTLPLILLLLDYWPLGRVLRGGSVYAGPPGILGRAIPGIGSPLRRSILLLTIEKVPLLAISAASSVITVVARQGATALSESSIGSRAANALVYTVLYLKRTLWPSGLSVHYAEAHTVGLVPWTTGQVVGSLIVVLGISIWVFGLLRRPYGAVGWLWYLIGLLPVIGLVPIGGEAIADRYTYMPLTGLFILAAWGTADLAGPRQVLRRGVVIAALVAVLGACLVGSRSQVRHWRDSMALFDHALDVNPGNPVIHTNLGALLASQGRLDEAIEHYEAALRVDPDHVNALGNLGAAHEARGELDQAVRYYRAGLRLEPRHAQLHFNLGNVLVARGRPDRAIAEYREAVRIEPAHFEAHNNLGNSLLSLGRVDEALDHYAEAVRLKPDYGQGYFNLGVALGSQGRIDEAIRQYRSALGLDPDHAEAHQNLADLLASRGRLDEAIHHYREVLRVKPDHPVARARLSAVSALRSGQRSR